MTRLISPVGSRCRDEPCKCEVDLCINSISEVVGTDRDRDDIRSDQPTDISDRSAIKSKKRQRGYGKRQRQETK